MYSDRLIFFGSVSSWRGITVNEKLLERRRELLKTRNYGVSLVDAVKNLSGKYHVSTRTIYYDWQHRKQWIEAVLDIQDPQAFFLELVANHKEIYRLAALEFLQADNSNARIGALRLLRDLNRDFEAMLVTKDLAERVETLEHESHERVRW
jgi:hypothetical protein